jgi:nucleoside-diphosphate-sugar epimerase
LPGTKILEILKRSMSLEGIKAIEDPSLLRPTDIMEKAGDPSRIKEELGWEPKIKIEQTIDDFVRDKEGRAV